MRAGLLWRVEDLKERDEPPAGCWMVMVEG
jgi:hypothetical protein